LCFVSCIFCFYGLSMHFWFVFSNQNSDVLSVRWCFVFSNVSRCFSEFS
jgi:hypothetical protein